MSTILQNSIWPNAGGTLGEIKAQIPDGVTVKWPDGDALVHNFVYHNGKLVGFVDTKALAANNSKSTTFPYDYVNITLDSILEDTMTIVPGERCKRLSIKYADIVKFLTPKLKNLLGEIKFELYFEKDIKKLIIHTDRITEDVLTSLETLLGEILPQTVETENYNHNIEIGWRDINKYAECVTVDDMLAVNPNYKNDLTSDGEWVYPLPKLSQGDYAFKDAPLRKFSVTLPSLVNGKQFFAGTALEGEMVLDLPNISTNGISQMFMLSQTSNNVSKLTKLTINAKQGSLLHQVISSEGSVKKDYSLEEFKFTGGTKSVTSVHSLARYRYALKRFSSDFEGNVEHWNDAFPESILDKESVLGILKASKIPVTPTSANIPSHFGIHVDYKDDEEVLAAIKTFEDGGWKLVIRWNGTPTSEISLIDLKEIWCKVIESEYGEYTDENGTCVSLDWGHHVTDTIGYKPFFSLEEAIAHFNIKPIERN